MKRTGCVGCPFNSRFEDDLEIVKKYEPNLYQAAVNVFGESHEYTRQYRLYKQKIWAERLEDRKERKRQYRRERYRKLGK